VIFRKLLIDLMCLLPGNCRENGKTAYLQRLMAKWLDDDLLLRPCPVRPNERRVNSIMSRVSSGRGRSV